METKYYDDELNDEFAVFDRKEKIIDENYKYYKRSFIWKILSFVAYRIIMIPIAFMYCKVKHHTKVINKGVLKEYKKNGYFMYANHTQVPADGYFPSIVSFPKKPAVVVNAANVSLKGTEQFMLMIGAFPIPTTLKGMSNFKTNLKKLCDKKRCVQIYPEAHIWPYYTKIRPFKSVSFRYPIENDKPTFCFTVTYQKRKHSKKPKITIYVDGPFYPNKELKIKEQIEDLRNQVYQTMVNRSKSSNYEYIKYVKRETI